MTVLVTGGAGFIGSNFVLDWFAQGTEAVVNLDKLTYAGNSENLRPLRDSPSHVFVHGDIGDRSVMKRLLEMHSPRAIVHFAAESHVDRSIHGPDEFIHTNVVGTFALLEEARAWWEKRPPSQRDEFRFLHVSTDEVFGSLAPHEPAFTETTPFAPNSPYAASKAAADHLVRAYHHTYGFPTLIVNCSNNYGPYQFPEKLIPLMILNAIAHKPLPVYGEGTNVRDWLFVRDHCSAIRQVLAGGRVGETYNVGGHNQKTNLEVVNAICDLLDEARPHSKTRHSSLISFVKDRPGHDRRYAMDFSKIAIQLGWAPSETFESGLRKTVAWYLDNPEWVAHVTSGTYRHWIEKNYGNRGNA
ncbi:MAG TPA: dTDP-glucose 4,6-dehydratase [Burkholderiales bacterium]|nr:dTDP-glucose 4,6-dehydratase [Burkholderiales bacterium]